MFQWTYVPRTQRLEHRQAHEQAHDDNHPIRTTKIGAERVRGGAQAYGGLGKPPRQRHLIK